jgi:hypothetical protein
MSYELTNEEKVVIITSRLNNISRNQYNIQMSKIEENAKVSPDKSSLSNLDAQLADVLNQIEALNKELLNITTSDAPASK